MYQQTFFSILFISTNILNCLTSASTDQCERDKCDNINKKCRNFDLETFKNSPSIFTFFPEGRLGNKISAFLNLYFLKLEFGLDVYYEKESFKLLNNFFPNAKLAVKVLEDELCNWKDFGFEKYEGNIELLGSKQWSIGKAVQIYLDRKNFMRHEVQGGRQYLKKYRKEMLEVLQFAPHIMEHVHKTQNSILKKIGRETKDVTFIGIHSRRTDYLEFRRKRLGLKDLYDGYFLDAIEYFEEEDFPNPVFLFISDDIPWGKEQIGHKKNVFFVGCGDGDDNDCIGKDFAILCNCNHTITSHGSFGTWGSIIAGGEIYTEYGAIIP